MSLRLERNMRMNTLALVLETVTELSNDGVLPSNSPQAGFLLGEAYTHSKK